MKKKEENIETKQIINSRMQESVHYLNFFLLEPRVFMKSLSLQYFFGGRIRFLNEKKKKKADLAGESVPFIIECAVGNMAHEQRI